MVTRPKSDLRAYQNRVVTRFYESAGVLAVLKMGAGKTISALTAIRELIDDGEIRHALVIAPKRVAELVWKQEAEAWEHTSGLAVRVLTGTPAQRSAALGLSGAGDVTVCGIDNAQWLVEQLEKLPPDHPIFDLLVLDETSKFKDPKSKRAKALRGLIERFKNVWGLTGTPRPNSLLDLWGPMQLITRKKLWPRSFYKWQRDHFFMPDPYGYDWAVLPGHAETIMAEAAPWTMTLDDADMPELPQLSILLEPVELPPAAREAYDSMEKRLFTGDVVAVNSAVAVGKLAQIANGFIYGGDSPYPVKLHDAKRDWLEEKKEALGGEPAILVYEYIEDARLIGEVFGDPPVLGRGSSEKDARLAVEMWNRRQGQYLVIHPAAAGHGLNLQAGGSRMLWISPPWSAEMWDQTIARLHRPGQADHVMVHVCCATDTIDDAKRARVIDKLSAQAAFEAYLRRWQTRNKAA
jgi:hypothetical protein